MGKGLKKWDPLEKGQFSYINSQKMCAHKGHREEKATCRVGGPFIKIRSFTPMGPEPWEKLSKGVGHF